MDQGGGVQHFNRGGQGHGAARLGVEQTRAEQRHRRPHAFATRGQQVLQGAGQGQVLVRQRRLAHLGFHRLQLRLDGRENICSRKGRDHSANSHRNNRAAFAVVAEATASSVLARTSANFSAT